jgi:hypothetical protein
MKMQSRFKPVPVFLISLALLASAIQSRAECRVGMDRRVVPVGPFKGNLEVRDSPSNNPAVYRDNQLVSEINVLVPQSPGTKEPLSSAGHNCLQLASVVQSAQNGEQLRVEADKVKSSSAASNIRVFSGDNPIAIFSSRGEDLQKVKNQLDQIINVAREASRETAHQPPATNTSESLKGINAILDILNSASNSNNPSSDAKATGNQMKKQVGRNPSENQQTGTGAHPTENSIAQ